MTTKTEDQQDYPRRWVMGQGFIYAPQEVTVVVERQELQDMIGPGHPDYEPDYDEDESEYDEFVVEENSEPVEVKNLTVTEFFGLTPPVIEKPYAYHYHAVDGGVEPIDLIMSQDMSFVEGNVVKYVTRWRRKDGLKDLQKAKVYLEWLIEDAERNPSKYV